MKKYLLVNTITAFSLVLGLTAIYFALHHQLYFSFALALLAFITDSMDGYLARRLKAESQFGAIFDTIADIFVYLIYPSVIFFNNFGMSSKIGLVLITIFILTGLFRLIRFTMQGLSASGEKKYYLGMPVFFSHFIVMIVMLFNLLNNNLSLIVTFLLVSIMSVLMVTKFRFRKPISNYLIIFLVIILAMSIIMFTL